MNILARANWLLGIAASVLWASSVVGSERLFDGETFDGWHGNHRYFRIVDEAIVGGMLHEPTPRNEFLSTSKEYDNFEFRLQFKLVGKATNAGIQIRSQRIPDNHEMIGYQADLGPGYCGFLYDESRRRTMLARSDKQDEILDRFEWNDYRIRCQGNEISLWINGYQTVRYREPDPSIPQKGLIALQIHSGPPGEVWYRNIEIEELPATPPPALHPGVRGLATLAPGKVTIDGDLTEFAQAFATPMGYFHADPENRAAQFFYLWDDTAFYAALRTLDASPANHAPDNRLWEGDGVEWYFDTRRGDDFRGKTWRKGSVHCYWVGLKGTEVQPRFCLRPGYLDAIPQIGVEVAAKRTPVGLDIEFKLPWANFPDFHPKSGAVIGIDAELCFSDGGPRIDRDFIYGSPLSVQQPASLAPVQLVESLSPSHWLNCGPVMMPLRCDTAWTQKTKPMVTATLALPPNHADQIGQVLFRVDDLSGATLLEAIGKISSFSKYGSFQRASAQWPVDYAPPGGHRLLAIVFDRKGNELSRIAPRMVSVRMEPGH